MRKATTMAISIPIPLASMIRESAARLGLSVSAYVTMRLYAGEKSAYSAIYGMEVIDDGDKETSHG